MSLTSINYKDLFPNGDLQERKLLITDSNKKDYLNGVPLYIDGEISLKFSSQFSSIYESEPNTLLNMLSSATNKPLSGQFAIQGAQIWKSTDPLEISVDAKLMMNDDALKDVVIPALSLSKLCLPSIGGFGKLEGLSKKLKCLIPPGPNIQAILNLDSIGIKGAKGTYNVKIGWLNLTNCIIKECSPEFNKIVDENGFPISANMSFVISTITIPTTDYLTDLEKSLKTQSVKNSLINTIITTMDDKLSNKTSYLNI